MATSAATITMTMREADRLKTVQAVAESPDEEDPEVTKLRAFSYSVAPTRLIDAGTD